MVTENDFMNEKLKQAREQLGLFLKKRREELCYSLEVVADAVGISANTLKRIEAGRFPFDVDIQHAIMRELSIKPFFVYADEVPDDMHLRREDDPSRYHGFYTSTNEMLYPGQLAITKLTYPRVFVRFIYEDSIFVTYEQWKQHIAVTEWLDGEKPSLEDQESVLTDCWNFLALDERYEEEI